MARPEAEENDYTYMSTFFRDDHIALDHFSIS